jgi:UDP-glucose 6-dehydrogenase
LGSVVSACCAKHFDVIAYDPSSEVVDNLNLGNAPIYEPELNNRIKVEMAMDMLQFTNDLSIYQMLHFLFIFIHLYLLKL